VGNSSGDANASDPMKLHFEAGEIQQTKHNLHEAMLSRAVNLDDGCHASIECLKTA